MSATGWDEILDVFEARLATQWASFQAGILDPFPPFEPAAVGTPLPQQLVSRATDLVWRCRALEDALAAAIADTREQLEQLDDAGASPSAPAQPVFFDSRV